MQPPLLTFVIPVRHQDNARDWSRLKSNLAQTAGSIAAQTRPGWQAVVVANHGADLPPLPSQFQVVRVDFDANLNHDLKGRDKEVFYEAFRIDKGRRVLKGMLAAGPSDYFMIVDDDDFISNRLVEFVAHHRGAAGWKIRDGYVWGDGGSLVYRHDDFANFCGTSLIIRSDLYELPASFAEASAAFIKDRLGSHVKIAAILQAAGTPLADLPFRGAVYRVGHSGAHSQSPGLVKMFLLKKSPWRHPRHFVRNLLRYAWLGREIRSEYFGGTLGGASR